MTGFGFITFEDAREFAKSLSKEAGVSVKVVRDSVEDSLPWRVIEPETHSAQAGKAYEGYWAEKFGSVGQDDGPFDPVDDDDGFDMAWRQDVEIDLIQSEIQSDAVSYYRSAEEGWFYSDDE